MGDGMAGVVAAFRHDGAPHAVGGAAERRVDGAGHACGHAPDQRQIGALEIAGAAMVGEGLRQRLDGRGRSWRRP